MPPEALWSVRVTAVLLWLAHGGYLAVTAAPWQEDDWSGLLPDVAADGQSPAPNRSAAPGCLVPLFMLAAIIRHRVLLDGCTKALVPVAALGLTILGWPVNPEWWQGVTWIDALYQLPAAIVMSSFLWISAGTFLTGYLAGRLMHRSFFGEKA